MRMHSASNWLQHVCINILYIIQVLYFSVIYWCIRGLCCGTDGKQITARNGTQPRTVFQQQLTSDLQLPQVQVFVNIFLPLYAGVIMCKHCLYQACRIRYACINAARQIRCTHGLFEKLYTLFSKAYHLCDQLYILQVLLTIHTRDASQLSVFS